MEKNNRVFKHVVLGGAFDRLHQGHKVLLQYACELCSERIVVGVTNFSKEMLAKKAFGELIEPLEKRIEKVREFIKSIKPELLAEVVGIDDAYGPTRTDPLLEAIVGSKETEKGCHMVNDLRRKNGLSQLEIFLVDCLGGEQDISQKVSSSKLREMEYMQAKTLASTVPPS